MTYDHSKRERHSAKAEIREAARKAQLREELEAADLDVALEDTFPASDPPSIIQPRTHPGAPERDHRSATEAQRRGH